MFVHISAVERAGLSTLNEGQRVSTKRSQSRKDVRRESQSQVTLWCVPGLRGFTAIGRSLGSRRKSWSRRRRWPSALEAEGRRSVHRRWTSARRGDSERPGKCCPPLLMESGPPMCWRASALVGQAALTHIEARRHRYAGGLDVARSIGGQVFSPALPDEATVGVSDILAARLGGRWLAPALPDGSRRWAIPAQLPSLGGKGRRRRGDEDSVGKLAAAAAAMMSLRMMFSTARFRFAFIHSGAVLPSPLARMCANIRSLAVTWITRVSYTPVQQPRRPCRSSFHGQWTANSLGVGLGQ